MLDENNRKMWETFNGSKTIEPLVRELSITEWEYLAKGIMEDFLIYELHQPMLSYNMVDRTVSKYKLYAEFDCSGIKARVYQDLTPGKARAVGTYRLYVLDVDQNLALGVEDDLRIYYELRPDGIYQVKEGIETMPKYDEMMYKLLADKKAEKDKEEALANVLTKYMVDDNGELITSTIADLKISDLFYIRDNYDGYFYGDERHSPMVNNEWRFKGVSIDLVFNDLLVNLYLFCDEDTWYHISTGENIYKNKTIKTQITFKLNEEDD